MTAAAGLGRRLRRHPLRRPPAPTARAATAGGWSAWSTASGPAWSCRPTPATTPTRPTPTASAAASRPPGPRGPGSRYDPPRLPFDVVEMLSVLRSRAGWRYAPLHVGVWSLGAAGCCTPRPPPAPGWCAADDPALGKRIAGYWRHRRLRCRLTLRRFASRRSRGRSRPSAATSPCRPGLSLAEIVAVAIPDPAWHEHAVVLIGDERIEPLLLARYRPKPGTLPRRPYRAARPERLADRRRWSASPSSPSPSRRDRRRADARDRRDLGRRCCRRRRRRCQHRRHLRC